MGCLALVVSTELVFAGLRANEEPFLGPFQLLWLSTRASCVDVNSKKVHASPAFGGTSAAKSKKE